MSKRIMVIDDDKTTRELVQHCLTEKGWEVFSYDYLQVSMEVVQQLTPDLIILDLNLVQAGEGWSFLQILNMEDTTTAIPVVVCTPMLNLPLEIEGYLATRHISIVRKPFDIEALLLTIKKNLTHDLTLPILVVEDNEDLSETVATLLQFEGYLVTTVSNGLLALNAVAQVQHALILLDIAMPVMNGLEFLEAYAQQPGLHSPVIVLSARIDLSKEQLPAFVIDRLPKPFEISRLVELVRKYA